MPAPLVNRPVPSDPATGTPGSTTQRPPSADESTQASVQTVEAASEAVIREATVFRAFLF